MLSADDSANVAGINLTDPVGSIREMVLDAIKNPRRRMVTEVVITSPSTFGNVIFDVPSAFAWWHTVAPIILRWLDWTLAERKDRHPFYNDVCSIKFDNGVSVGVHVPIAAIDGGIDAFRADCEKSLAKYVRTEQAWRVARVKWEMVYGDHSTDPAVSVAAECGASVESIREIVAEINTSPFYKKWRTLFEAIQTESQTQA